MSSRDEEVTECCGPGWRNIDPLDLSPILAAAVDLFYEKGFHGTSVREILAASGVTAPTLYYHHKSKEGVLLDLLNHSTRDVIARITSAKDAAGKSPSVQLSNMIEAIVLPMATRSRLAALEGEVRYLGEENRLRYRRTRKQVGEAVVTVINDGKLSGEFRARDAVETTRAILGMCQAIPRWYKSDGELSPESVARKYAEIALYTAGSSALLNEPLSPCGSGGATAVGWAGYGSELFLEPGN